MPLSGRLRATVPSSAQRLAACCIVSLAIGATPARAQEIPLWPDGAPGARGSAAADKPGITPYPAARPNGAAVIILPGGAYVGLAMDHEGQAPARWLAGLGVSAFVVRYRLGSNGYRHPIMMWDAQRAIRWVKANAARYGIDTARVGVFGFSAGGHLASTVSTHYDAGNPAAPDSVDRQPCRPAFSVLGYPVITMDRAFTHLQSRENLIGTAPGQALVDSLSNEKQVDARTPPGFLFHSTDDDVVPIRNAQAYHDSLRKRGVDAKLMTFTQGGHGYGMADGRFGAPTNAVLRVWPDTLARWLGAKGFLDVPVSLRRAAVPETPARGAPRGGAVLRLPTTDGADPDALGRRGREPAVPEPARAR